MTTNNPSPNPVQTVRTITDGYNQGKQLIQMLRELGYAILIAFCSLLSMPVEIVGHRTHGVRTITLMRFTLSVMAMIAIMSFPFGGSEGSRSVDVRGIGMGLLMAIALFVLLIRRWWVAQRRFKAGERVYSKSTSDPYGVWFRIPFVKTQWQAMRWAEPLTLIAFGSVGFAAFRSGLFLYVAIAGLALLLKHALTEKRINDRLMDAMDGELEASEITTALKGGNRKAKPEHGFVVPIVVPPTRTPPNRQR